MMTFMRKSTKRMCARFWWRSPRHRTFICRQERPSARARTWESTIDLEVLAFLVLCCWEGQTTHFLSFLCLCDLKLEVIWVTLSPQAHNGSLCLSLMLHVPRWQWAVEDLRFHQEPVLSWVPQKSLKYQIAIKVWTQFTLKVSFLWVQNSTACSDSARSRDRNLRCFKHCCSFFLNLVSTSEFAFFVIAKLTVDAWSEHRKKGDRRHGNE